jgi:hypothetical protein
MSIYPRRRVTARQLEKVTDSLGGWLVLKAEAANGDRPVSSTEVSRLYIAAERAVAAAGAYAVAAMELAYNRVPTRNLFGEFQQIAAELTRLSTEGAAS